MPLKTLVINVNYSQEFLHESENRKRHGILQILSFFQIFFQKQEMEEKDIVFQFTLQP